MNKFRIVLILSVLLLTSCSNSQELVDDSQKEQLTEEIAVNDEVDEVEKELADDESSPEIDEELPEDIEMPDSEIIIWHIFSDEIEEELQRIVENYNSKENGIIVEAVSKESKDLQMALKDGHSNFAKIDMMIDFPFMLEEGFLNDSFTDLSRYIEDESIGISNFDSLVEKNIKNEMSQKGGIYNFPLSRTGNIIYYNKTLLDSLNLKMPSNWDELELTSKEIMAKTGKPAFGTESAIEFIDSYLNSYSDIYIDDKLNVNSAESLEALNRLKSNFKENLYIFNTDDGSLLGAFETGEIAFYMASSYYSDIINHEDGGFEIGYSAMPSNPKKPYKLMVGPSIFVLNSDESRQRASFDFIKYMVEEGSIPFSKLYGGAVPYKLEDNDEYIEYNQDPVIKVLNDMQKDAGYIPMIPGIIDSRFYFNEIMNAILDQDMDLKSAIEGIQAEIDK
ncbi:MAG: extracellular solute-binding protein [Tissierellia bacterium]|nr:extracellular solute-binding protein [Tissierellia bacterium]